MSKGINKVILLGYLGANPEVITTKSGKAMATFSIATESQYRDHDSGELIKNTEWHRIVTFGSLAGIVKEYLVKGSHIYLSGSLKTRKWTDKHGSDKYITEVIGKELVMLGKGHSETREKADVTNVIRNDNFDDIPF